MSWRKVISIAVWCSEEAGWEGAAPLGSAVKVTFPRAVFLPLCAEPPVRLPHQSGAGEGGGAGADTPGWPQHARSLGCRCGARGVCLTLGSTWLCPSLGGLSGGVPTFVRAGKVPRWVQGVAEDGCGFPIGVDWYECKSEA